MLAAIGNAIAGIVVWIVATIADAAEWVWREFVALWRWIRASTIPFVWWLGRVLPPAVRAALRITLLTYVVWIVVTLALFLTLGSLYHVWGLAFILWIAFGLLAPLLWIPRVRPFVFAILGVVFLGLLLQFSGVAPVYITAITAVVLTIIFLRFVPIPSWIRTMVGGALAAGLVLALLLGGLDRLVPTFKSALGLAKYRGEQQSATLVGGSELFDPKTGLPRAKVNPRTGEIFVGERIVYQFDPRTGEPLVALTREKLIELCKRKEGAPGMLAKLCEQLGVVEPPKREAVKQSQRAEAAPVAPPPPIPFPPPVFPTPIEPAPQTMTPALPATSWDWEKFFPSAGEYVTDFAIRPATSWTLWGDRDFWIRGSGDQPWFVVRIRADGTSGDCGINPWRYGPGDRALHVRTTGGSTVVKLKLCR